MDAVTPERTRAAAEEIRTGRTVTLAAPVETWPGPDDPEPASHRFTSGPEAEADARGLYFATDRFAMNVRGVLLDIPRLRAVPWLEPGGHVTYEDLDAAEKAQQVRVGEGDLLLQ